MFSQLLIAVNQQGSVILADQSDTLNLNPFYSCGANSLAIVAKWHGLSTSLSEVETALQPSSRGETSVATLEQTSRRLGMNPVAARVKLDQLDRVPLPAIVHLQRRSHLSETNHYAVLAGLDPRGVIIINARELPRMQTYQDFAKVWTGVVLAFPDTPARRDKFVASQADQHGEKT